jgi:carbon monoxide dehydrogenase subunit G
MELENSFSVEVPIERAWEVLTDVPRIAPCLPGAKLTEVDGDDYKGIVKVKVGPIVAQYKGAATFVETDEQAHRIVLRAEGRETRGQGNATATITAVLTPDGDNTQVIVHTDMAITGKAAQFSRGVMAEVSSKLMKQFSDNLATTVLGAEAEAGAASGAEDAKSSVAGSTAGSSTAAASSSTGTRTSGPTGGAEPHVPGTPGEPEPIDLLGVAGGATAKRVVPAVVAAVLVLLLVRLLLRRRRS